MRTVAAVVVAIAPMLGSMACSSISKSTSGPKVAPVVAHGLSVPSGTRLKVELEQGLGKNSSVGQLYTAKVIQPVVDDRGQPVIPEGSEVVGHVQKVQQASGTTTARIHLTVDKIEVHGVNHALAGRFVSVDPEAHKEVESGAVHAAGRGATTGLITGGPPGAVIGGLLGATTGSVISLHRVSDETLPQGTTLTLEIESSIPIAALRGAATG